MAHNHVEKQEFNTCIKNTSPIHLSSNYLKLYMMVVYADKLKKAISQKILQHGKRK